MIIVNNSYHCEHHVHNMANVIEHEGFDLDNQACMLALKKACPCSHHATSEPLPDIA